MKIRAAVLNGPEIYPEIQEFTLVKENDKLTVEVIASALNHRDVWIQKGMYGGIKYPIILGSDGLVMHQGNKYLLNPGISWGADEDFHGDDFVILGLPAHGTFADHVQIGKEYLVSAPNHLSDVENAALPLAGLTAYRALFSRAKLTKTDKVFVSGIGGGVALFAMQFAIANGNEVYVSSSSSEKIEKAVKLGAKAGFNYKDDDMHKQVLKSVGPMDVIIDSAGGKGFSKLVNICAKGARISVYGGTAGKIELSPQRLFWNHVTILGTTMGSDSDFSKMVAYVERHKIKPVIDKVYPLGEIEEALKRMEAGKQFGKIVLKNN